jgi:ABC-2 type transport system ATP-binding protein
MENALISIENLSAAYGRGSKRNQALKGVSLQVERGDIFGLLGPNGAGKTTLLSCLEGLHRPEGGRVVVAGRDTAREMPAIKRDLGIQLQRTALMDDLTAGELIEIYAAMYNVFFSVGEIDALLADFGLEGLRNKYPRRMSGGQQQRLALALAVVNDPQVVLLDEPTGQLDPHARRSVWDLVRRMHAEGRTILLTTHSMEEAEALCGRVAIIDKGQVIACDTPARLINGLKAGSVLKTSLDLPLDLVEPLPGVLSARYSGQHLEIETLQPQDTLAALQSLAGSQGRLVGDVMLRQPNLEDVFLRLTGRSLEVGIEER